MTRRRNILTGQKKTKKRDWHKKAGGSKAKGSAMASHGSASHGTSPSVIVPTFLHMLNTVKLYHWKTTSFSTHKATDELYGTLNEQLDKFVEVMLGKREMGGRKLLNVSMIKLGVYSNNNAFE